MLRTPPILSNITYIIDSRSLMSCCTAQSPQEPAFVEPTKMSLSTPPVTSALPASP